MIVGRRDLSVRQPCSMRKDSRSEAKKSSPRVSVIRTKLAISSPPLYVRMAGTPLTLKCFERPAEDACN